MMRCNVFFARNSLFDMNTSQSVAKRKGGKLCQISEREIALVKEKKNTHIIIEFDLRNSKYKLDV